MGRSVFNKNQVKDEDFALQSELDAVKDNTTGLFQASTMNNKVLYDLLQLIKDNNTSTFIASLMNNKKLYDDIMGRVFGSGIQYTPLDTTFTGTTSTSYINKQTLNTTQLAENARYILEYKFNYTGAANNPATYTDVRLLVDNNPVPVMYETNQNYNIASVGHLISDFYILNTTISTQHQIILQFRSSNGVGVRLGNSQMILYRLD